MILQQFLPFVRLDGYYIMTDLIGVPDLFGRIRPILLSVLPGRPRPPAVTPLTPRARALVTMWVGLTVALLGAVVLLFVVRLPHLAPSAWNSIARRAQVLLAAAQAGALRAAVSTGLQLALLVIPAVGIVLTVYGAGDPRWDRRSMTGVRRRRPPESPRAVVEHRSSSLNADVTSNGVRTLVTRLRWPEWIT